MEAPGLDPKLQLLQRVPLFAGLATEELAAIGSITEEREVDAGTALTHEGRHEGYFFVIVSGTVRIERGGQTINTLRDGDFLGEISLLDGGPRSATVVADTPVVAIRLFKSSFDRVIKQEPKVAAKILAVVARRLRDAESTISS